ncbi:MAG: hypothetical protein ABI539_03685 [Acidobacteriota bacterium]
MKITNSLTLIAIFILGVSASAQTPARTSIPAKLPLVSEIFAAHVKAIGGAAANERIRSRLSKGAVEMSPMGIKGTFESLVAAPDLSLVKMSIPGIGDLVEGYDGKSAWAVNPIQGSREKSGAELAQTKANNDFYGDIHLAGKYKKATVTGMEKVEGHDAYVVKGETSSLGTDTLYFDTQTGLLLRVDTEIVSPQGNQPAKIFYEDFREIDGVKLAFKNRTVLPQMELVMITTEIKHGVDAEPAKFAKPKV